VGHEHSILFGPVNALLRVVLGDPSPAWQRALGIEEALGAWLPDHVVMALLVVALVAVLLPARRRYLSSGPPVQVLELLLSGSATATT
jgi:hypothetical protein